MCQFVDFEGEVCVNLSISRAGYVSIPCRSVSLLPRRNQSSDPAHSLNNRVP